MTTKRVSMPEAVSSLQALVDKATSPAQGQLVAKSLAFSRYETSDVTESLLAACDSLLTLAAAEVTDQNTLENIEYCFMSDFGTDRLLPLSLLYDPRLKWALSSIVAEKLPQINLPSASAGGRDWERIGKALLDRRQELHIEPDVDDEPTFFVEEFRGLADSQLRSAKAAAAPQPMPAEPARPEAVAEGDASAGRHSVGYEPAYLTDGSRVARSVQGSFSTVNVDDSSKFGGILAEFPAWDMWNKRFVSLMKSSFKELTSDRQVEFLSDALTGDAQRFYHD